MVSQVGQLRFEHVQGKAAALPRRMHGAQQVVWRCNGPAPLPLVLDAAGRLRLDNSRCCRENCMRVDSAHAKRTCAYNILLTPCSVDKHPKTLNRVKG